MNLKAIVLLLVPVCLCSPVYAVEEIRDRSSSEAFFAVKPDRSASSSSGEADRFPFIGLINGNCVNLRSGPSSSHEVFHQLFKGDQVCVVAVTADWYAVQLPCEASAYVARSFLEDNLQGGARVRGSRVHARAGAGLSYASLGFLLDRQPVLVRRTVGDWAEIQAPEKCRGWINHSYVTYLSSTKETTDGDDRTIPSNPAESSEDSGSQGASQR